MEIEIDRDKLIDIWDEYCGLHENDAELFEFITDVDLGINILQTFSYLCKDYSL